MRSYRKWLHTNLRRKVLFLGQKNTRTKITVCTVNSGHLGQYLAFREMRMKVAYYFYSKIIFVVENPEK